MTLELACAIGSLVLALVALRAYVKTRFLLQGTIISAALRDKSPLSSLELQDMLRDAGVGWPNGYVVLRHLEHIGILESYEGEPLPERGGRPRRYYQFKRAQP